MKLKKRHSKLFKVIAMAVVCLFLWNSTAYDCFSRPTVAPAAPTSHLGIAIGDILGLPAWDTERIRMATRALLAKVIPDGLTLHDVDLRAQLEKSQDMLRGLDFGPLTPCVYGTSCIGEQWYMRWWVVDERSDEPRPYIASFPGTGGLEIAVYPEAFQAEAASAEELLWRVTYDDYEKMRGAKSIEVLEAEGNDDDKLVIQNNRSGVCSYGKCAECYKYHQIRGGKKVKTDPMSPAEIEDMIKQALGFGIRRIQVLGEDSFDDWETLIDILKTCAACEGDHPHFKRVEVVSNGVLLIKDTSAVESRLQDIVNTGISRLHLVFSWDVDKVKELAFETGVNEDAIVTNMAEVIAAFRKLLPGQTLSINNVSAKEKRGLNDQFIRTLRKRVSSVATGKGVSKARFPGVITNLEKFFRPGSLAGEGLWRDRFRKLVGKAHAEKFTCRFEPTVNMHSHSMSSCAVFENNQRRPVTPETFIGAVMAPLQHPVGRHRYLGSKEERGLSRCREFLFACSLRPDYWNTRDFFTQFETRVINHKDMMVKIGVLFLLRDILISYDNEHIPPRSRLSSFPKELVPMLLSDEIVGAYVRYYHAITDEQLMEDGKGLRVASDILSPLSDRSESEKIRALGDFLASEVLPRYHDEAGSAPTGAEEVASLSALWERLSPEIAQRLLDLDAIAMRPSPNLSKSGLGMGAYLGKHTMRRALEKLAGAKKIPCYAELSEEPSVHDIMEVHRANRSTTQFDEYALLFVNKRWLIVRGNRGAESDKDNMYNFADIDTYLHVHDTEMQVEGEKAERYPSDIDLERVSYTTGHHFILCNDGISAFSAEDPIPLFISFSKLDPGLKVSQLISSLPLPETDASGAKAVAAGAAEAKVHEVKAKAWQRIARLGTVEEIGTMDTVELAKSLDTKEVGMIYDQIPGELYPVFYIDESLWQMIVKERDMLGPGAYSARLRHYSPQHRAYIISLEINGPGRYYSRRRLQEYEEKTKRNGKIPLFHEYCEEVFDTAGLVDKDCKYVLGHARLEVLEMQFQIIQVMGWKAAFVLERDVLKEDIRQAYIEIQSRDIDESRYRERAQLLQKAEELLRTVDSPGFNQEAHRVWSEARAMSGDQGANEDTGAVETYGLAGEAVARLREVVAYLKERVWPKSFKRTTKRTRIPPSPYEEWEVSVPDELEVKTDCDPNDIVNPDLAVGMSGAATGHTKTGRRFARMLAASTAEYGRRRGITVSVVTGGAPGTDSAALEGTLENRGTAVAVQPWRTRMGIFRNTEKKRRLMKQGGIVSARLGPWKKRSFTAVPNEDVNESHIQPGPVSEGLRKVFRARTGIALSGEAAIVERKGQGPQLRDGPRAYDIKKKGKGWSFSATDIDLALERDAIITALSDLVVVVECDKGGGTVDTGFKSMLQGVPLVVVDWKSIEHGSAQVLTGGNEELMQVSVPADRPKPRSFPQGEGQADILSDQNTFNEYWHAFLDQMLESRDPNSCRRSRIGEKTRPDADAVKRKAIDRFIAETPEITYKSLGKKRGLVAVCAAADHPFAILNWEIAELTGDLAGACSIVHIDNEKEHQHNDTVYFEEFDAEWPADINLERDKKVLRKMSRKFPTIFSSCVLFPAHKKLKFSMLFDVFPHIFGAPRIDSFKKVIYSSVKSARPLPYCETGESANYYEKLLPRLMAEYDADNDFFGETVIIDVDLDVYLSLDDSADNNEKAINAMIEKSAPVIREFIEFLEKKGKRVILSVTPSRQWIRYVQSSIGVTGDDMDRIARHFSEHVLGDASLLDVSQCVIPAGAADAVAISSSEAKKEVVEMLPAAERAHVGLVKKLPQQKTRVIVDEDIFEPGAYEKDVTGRLLDERYIAAGDICDLEKCNTKSVDAILRALQNTEHPPERTIVQVSSTLSADDVGKLRDRAPQGVRFMRVDTDALSVKYNNELDPETKWKLRFNLYAMLLAARDITDEDMRLREASPVYRMLHFFLRTHGAEDADTYIAELGRDNLAYLIQHALSFVPIGPWSTATEHYFIGIRYVAGAA